MASILDLQANPGNILSRVRELERRVALLSRALSAQGYVDAINDDPETPAIGNADTVDGYHASLIPTPGYLLALDGSGLLPAGALEDIVTLDWTGAHGFPATGITLGGDVGLSRGAEGRLDLAAGNDLAIDGGVLFVDASEDVVLVNVGLTPPTYRGALTVWPVNADQRARVTRAYTAQAVNLEEWRAADDRLWMRITQDGDLESGAFTSGLVGWQVSQAGNAEFNSVVARGEFRASVFVIGEMHAEGGTLMVLEASVLAEQVTTV